jgi:hypothetical protein
MVVEQGNVDTAAEIDGRIVKRQVVQLGPEIPEIDVIYVSPCWNGST